jgi:hypothetical protein
VGAWVKAEDNLSGNPNVIEKLGSNSESNLRMQLNNSAGAYRLVTDAQNDEGAWVVRQ